MNPVLVRDATGQIRPLVKPQPGFGGGGTVPTYPALADDPCKCCGPAGICNPPCPSCGDCFNAIRGIGISVSGTPTGDCVALCGGVNGTQTFFTEDGSWSLTQLISDGVSLKQYAVRWATGTCEDPGLLVWQRCVGTRYEVKSYNSGLVASVRCIGNAIELTAASVEGNSYGPDCARGFGAPGTGIPFEIVTVPYTELCSSQGRLQISLSGSTCLGNFTSTLTAWLIG